MRKAGLLGALVGFGVFVQILLGESGFAAGSLRDVHAAIGLLGLAVVLAFVVAVRGSLVRVAAASVVAVVTIAQVVLGLSLYGILPLGMSHQALEASHRDTAYLLFVSGIAVSVLSIISGRRTKR
ncbi:MAG: hypothetical protein QW614_03420 [Candidatus Caldarchaeum sp.]|uniref:Uncharacterized protein n=1 Tax=Caldiarchaeum subterraneum TaxID=311458 RepID=A0A7C5Q782_CALS0